jgi:hypothetical protein
MQLRAVPELIWRTATVSHTLGADPHRVDVKPGDIVVAGAISATQQNLQEGRPELYHAFGGNRSVPDHPTHACPGANPALAVMLGFFSALVESPLPLRAGPGPLTIGLDGRLPPPAGAPIVASALEEDVPVAHRARHAFQIRAANVLLNSAKTPLATIGDSWLFNFWRDNGSFSRPNLMWSLDSLGYYPERGFHLWGTRLEEMANPASLTALTRYFTNHDPSRPKPKALLIGGGGNDVVYGFEDDVKKTPLYKLLSPRAGEDPLVEAEVYKFIDGTLAGFYRTIIDCIVVELKGHTDIPILIHSYDHPIPDGREDAKSGNGPWLKPVFGARGISDLTVSRDVMRRLIDRLNKMVADVAKTNPGRVYPINLTGTLAAGYGTPDKYELLWANELHPNMTGFDRLAAVIAARLKTLGI